MKLLRDFFRLRLAGVRAATGRPAPLPRDFSVTVPPPLAAGPAARSSVVVELPRTANRRREPASFLRSPRHLSLGGGRR